MIFQKEKQKQRNVAPYEGQAVRLDHAEGGLQCSQGPGHGREKQEAQHLQPVRQRLG